MTHWEKRDTSIISKGMLSRMCGREEVKGTERMREGERRGGTWVTEKELGCRKLVRNGWREGTRERGRKRDRENERDGSVTWREKQGMDVMVRSQSADTVTVFGLRQ